MFKYLTPSLFLFLFTIFISGCSANQPVEYQLWDKVTLDFEGPELSESEETFTEYRLDVHFINHRTGSSYYVPGYFAADGDAAETSATSGNIWRVNFSPDETGEWLYVASFRKGEGAAISLDPGVGESAGFFDGESGSFMVTERTSSEITRDFKTKGRLEYVGEHYLQFAGSKQFFIKGGAGSPENFLAYEDFDGTKDKGGTHFPALGENQLHAFKPHAINWEEGDPSWQDGKGTEIIGALNYIADQGLNAAYLLLMNVHGDGDDIWPWVEPEEVYVYDVSKLAQWEIVFDHMDELGIVRDFMLSETENESFLEVFEGVGSNFADSRKLFYREMIARFGHNLGVSWNIGEENGWSDGEPTELYKIGNTDEQRILFANYIKEVDPYDHHLVVHTFPEHHLNLIFTPLLGTDGYDGMSIQTHHTYADTTLRYRQRSIDAGKKWVLAIDEPMGWEYGLRPDIDDPEHDEARIEVLWEPLLAGGAGVDWYFGWQNNAPTSDLSNEDWRSRENMWIQTKIALDFFNEHVPFQQMEPANELVTGEGVSAFAKEGEVYLVYMRSPTTTSLDLEGIDGDFSVLWFNPQEGGGLQQGSVNEVSGGSKVSLGNSPQGREKDWAVLVKVK
ncbi:MAG: DUF5060 domain-containing protein [Balneola sp.]|nr:MAG: DUF5060 domain-containing protein [Balneola sp.]